LHRYPLWCRNGRGHCRVVVCAGVSGTQSCSFFMRRDAAGSGGWVATMIRVLLAQQLEKTGKKSVQKPVFSHLHLCDRTPAPPPISARLPHRQLHQRKAGSAVAVISSEAGHPEKIALMPRVLVALASVGLRASSFTLSSSRRLPNAFRRNMGALQSTAASSVSQQPHAIDAPAAPRPRPPARRAPTRPSSRK
jgi:hypothetical protein